MKLTWAVDGFGRRTICHQDLKEFPKVLCPLRPEDFWELMGILEQHTQENHHEISTASPLRNQPKNG